MKTKNKTATIVAAVIVAIGITTVVVMGQPAAQPNNTQQATANEQTETTETVRFTAEPGKTVLDQLKDRAKIATKDSQYGPYVDAINGTYSGTDGKYWSFYVNGKLAQKGAAEYVTNGGEEVEWKLEAFE